MEIPVGRQKLEVADIMGNRTEVETDGGVLKLTLTESPVYVLGVDSTLWGRGAVRVLMPDCGRIDTIAGKEVAIKGTLNATGSALNGTLTLIFDKRTKLAPVSQNVVLAPHASQAFSFTVPLPATLAKGKYPLTLTLVSNGRNAGANGLLLNVEAQVLISHLEPAFKNGRQAFKIRMTEIAGFPAKGTLETRVVGYPEGRQKVDFSLAAGATKDILIDFDGLEVAPFDVSKAEVKVTLDSGYRFTQSENINWISASYQPEVGSNGDFSAWKDVKLFRIDPKNVVRSAFYHKGAKDLDASVAFGWNEAYLLFQVDVLDDVFSQPFSGWKTWAGDSLQFGFARDIKAQKSDNTLADAAAEAYSEIDFALAGNRPEIYRTVSFNQELLPIGAIDLNECPFSATREPLPENRIRMVYRIAVPWKYMNLAHPAAGQRVYWAATVNDLDDEKQSDVSALGVFDLKHQVPKQFGEIVLVP